MKILITGANGMLAKEVKEKFQKNNELICTDVQDLDITDYEAVINYVTKIKPDYIINCAAFTAVDKAETAGEIVEKINAIGPENLAKAAKKTNSILIHISTDYVYGGNLELNRTYKEEDKKTPNTAYGITKLLGEEKIKENLDKYYIFRTAWLYGIGGNNFVKTMTNLCSKMEEINVVSDQHGSPTYAKDLSNIIYEAIERKIPYGIYNATNEGYTTWYEFAKKIIEKQNIKCKINPVTTDRYIEMMKITQAKRPLNSQMSKEKLIGQGINIPSWEDGLDRYLKEEGSVKNEK